MSENDSLERIRDDITGVRESIGKIETSIAGIEGTCKTCQSTLKNHTLAINGEPTSHDGGIRTRVTVVEKAVTEHIKSSRETGRQRGVVMGGLIVTTFAAILALIFSLVAG